MTSTDDTSLYQNEDVRTGVEARFKAYTARLSLRLRGFIPPAGRAA